MASLTQEPFIIYFQDKTYQANPSYPSQLNEQWQSRLRELSPNNLTGDGEPLRMPREPEAVVKEAIALLNKIALLGSLVRNI